VEGATAATVLYFGPDQSYCLPVLENAGHRIDNAISIRRAIRSPVDQRPFCRIDGGCRRKTVHEAVHITRADTLSPIIFFPGRSTRDYVIKLDLVVSPFVPPEQWSG